MSDHRRTNRFIRRPAGTRVPLPESYMPAMPPLGLMEAIARGIAGGLGAWRRRRALKPLLALDGHLLRDIGVDRASVARALGRGASRIDAGANDSDRRGRGEHCA